ncbi:MAG: hypothetical protein L6R37_007747 [Teloschistes peruensis]|nr:MAG: hypothetical protein L6R37_007747 [Teloschistes peruensis]
MRFANRGIKSVLQTVSLVEDKMVRNGTHFDHPTPAANFLVPSPVGVQEAHASRPSMTAAPAHQTAEISRDWRRTIHHDRRPIGIWYFLEGDIATIFQGYRNASLGYSGLRNTETQLMNTVKHGTGLMGQTKAIFTLETSSMTTK